MTQRRTLPSLPAAGAAALLALSACRDSPAGELGRAPAHRDPAVPAALAQARPALRGQLGAQVDSSRRTAIVAAAERVAPAVVSVNVVRRERVVPRSIFEQLMLPPGAAREVAGLGSGFIIRADGLVVTNEHVVRGADAVVVTLADGRELDARVVGTDEVNDLALLRLQELGGAPLPVAPLGDSDGLMIGEWVVAIGNPFGFLLSNPEPSVSAGVVSATGRNLIPQENGQQRGYYLDMIQTDAAINPGNSGGPLVNALGEVVGVNSSILSSTGGSEGLGFAIPISRARRIALDLADDGRIRRAWVGAEMEAVPAEGMRRMLGVRISRVVPGSPAARAGLREGMLVRAVGHKPVRTPLDWDAALLNSAYGQALEVRVGDGGTDRAIRVTTGDIPSMTAARIQALRDFQLVTLTPTIRAERGLANERGALIVGLSEDARNVGLREGDLILQINRLRVETAEAAAQALQQMAGGWVVLYVERNGRVGSVQFSIGG
ncbi:MAG TPA: trypsin-like peptidase domain-containing protein [Longimicrobiaceae bacterium]|nr:trypsin-like peptidase domain-containing protein [Longimicrobiaceae bacterium]